MADGSVDRAPVAWDETGIARLKPLRGRPLADGSVPAAPLCVSYVAHLRTKPDLPDGLRGSRGAWPAFADVVLWSDGAT